MSTTIRTLSELMQASQCRYQIVDLGRRIQPIELSLFEDVEQGRQPYPFPLQRHAHLAVAYWVESQEPWIWFLKFPLDERGLLNQADVGQFLKYVTDALGVQLAQQDLTEEMQEYLANNPYTFKPQEDKMAVFHSHIRAYLNLPTSQYYPSALAYFQGNISWNNFQNIGLQGVADICARLSDNNHEAMICDALAPLSSNSENHPALYALLGTLEHSTVSEHLMKCLQQQATSKPVSEDIFLLAAYIRAMSGGPEVMQKAFIKQILEAKTECDKDLLHRELLIAIAGRCWAILADDDLANLFLLRLAQTQEQHLFNQLFADLVMIPKLRFTLLPLLNNVPSDELAQALVALQRQTKPLH